MSVLELHSVSKVYGQGRPRCTPCGTISLDVEAGVMVAVMGASGSGKSTLLTIAGSLDDPTSGDVLVAGAQLGNLSRSAKAKLRRRSIGYVFQDYNLLAGLTAVENVALPLELDGVAARKAQVDRAADARRPWSRRSGRALIPTNSPVVNGNGCRSLAPSLATGGCCSPMSRPARSTRPTPKPSCGSCSPPAAVASPPSSSRMTRSSRRGPTAWSSFETGASSTKRRHRHPGITAGSRAAARARGHDDGHSRSPEPSTRDGGAPARRAVVRWAWRLFRREWRQQLLVLALIILAVAATILGAAIASNTPPPANLGFGTANHLVTIPGLRSAPIAPTSPPSRLISAPPM